MYSWDLTPYSSYDWRIQHALSHHIFPNSILDFEVTVMQPFVWWLPVKKSILYKLYEPFLAQLLYCIAMPISVSIVLYFWAVYTGTALRELLGGLEY